MPFAAMPGSDSEVGPIATPDAPALMMVLERQPQGSEMRERIYCVASTCDGFIAPKVFRFFPESLSKQLLN